MELDRWMGRMVEHEGASVHDLRGFVAAAVLGGGGDVGAELLGGECHLLQPRL